jgi:cephalosporin hydroxylase
LTLVDNIHADMEGRSFHQHYHILWDIRNQIDKEEVNYLEIGTFFGASAALMSASPKKTNIYAVDLDIEKLDIISSNINKFGLEHNTFKYIVGDSQTKATVDFVKSIVSEVDILYIDGDHTYYGVINDFLNYKDLVLPGGYIVFDDYNDWKYCPVVKHGVDYLVNNYLHDEFEVIGAQRNIMKALPKSMEFSNEFIIRRKI